MLMLKILWLLLKHINISFYHETMCKIMIWYSLGNNLKKCFNLPDGNNGILSISGYFKSIYIYKHKNSSDVLRSINILPKKRNFNAWNKNKEETV